MGYTSGWRTRSELIEELTGSRRVQLPFYADGRQEKGIIFDGNWDQLVWREVGTRTTIARFASGNTLWAVEEVRYDEWYCCADNRERTERCIIVCYLSLDRQSRAGERVWGYKRESENVYPYEYSCPLKFLAMVPEPATAARGRYVGVQHENGVPALDGDGRAVEVFDGVPWRERVRGYWAQKRRPSDLRPGDVFDFPEGYRPRSLVITGTKRTIRGKGDDGREYRVKPRHLNAATRRPPAPPAVPAEQLGFAV